MYNFWTKLKSLFGKKEEPIGSAPAEPIERFQQPEAGLYIDVATEFDVLNKFLGDEAGKSFYAYLVGLFKSITVEDFLESMGRVTSLGGAKETFNAQESMTKFDSYCLGFTDGIASIRGISKLIFHRQVFGQQYCAVVGLKSLSVVEYPDAEFFINGTLYTEPIRAYIYDAEEENKVLIKTETQQPIMDSMADIKVLADGVVLFDGSKVDGAQEPGVDVLDTEKIERVSKKISTETLNKLNKKDPKYNN